MIGVLLPCPVCGGCEAEVLGVVGLICAIYAWQKWMAVARAYRDAESRAHWRDFDRQYGMS